MPLHPTTWSTTTAIAGLALLLALGTWQLQRLAWKEDVVERLESRLTATPTVLSAEPIDPEQYKFRRVSVTGEFFHESEFYLLNRVREGVVGVHVITPLRRSDDASFVLVDRGWVPLNQRDPASRREGQIAGITTLDAVVRRSSEKGWFVPENRAASNEWYFIDPAAMAATAKVAAPGDFYLAAIGHDAPNNYPLGQGAEVSVRNDHLGYAITWYTLAAVLVAIYFVHARKRRP